MKKVHLLLCVIFSFSVISCKQKPNESVSINDTSSSLTEEISNSEVDTKNSNTESVSSDKEVSSLESESPSESVKEISTEESTSQVESDEESESKDENITLNVSLINDMSAVEIATNSNAKEFIQTAFTATVTEVIKSYLDCGGLKLGSSSSDGSITLDFGDLTISKVELLAHQYYKSYSYQAGGETVSGMSIDNEASLSVNGIEHSFTMYAEKGEPISETITVDFDSTNTLTLSSLNGRIIIFNLVVYFD